MIKLLLPILFPSWRFFSNIGASPRVEFGFVADINAQPTEWILFRPLPARVGFWRGLGRLWHNPKWNECLYVNTCAEHLFDSHSVFYEQEIGRRLLATIAAGEYVVPHDARFMVYRIRAVVRDGECRDGEFRDENNSCVIRDEVAFIAQPLALTAVGERG